MIPFRPEAPAFRILSLDGGGIRGAFTAAFLAEIERQLSHPIGEYFDLIAGTSTGGIIALALALGVPAARIQTFYCEHGPLIFKRRPSRLRWPKPVKDVVNRALRRVGVDVDWLMHSKYEAGCLRTSLQEVFGDRTLEEAETRLLIPSIDLTNGRPVTFKTPHQPNFVRDRRFRAVEVALATSAAPSYFPHAVIEGGSAYIDGGFWANNPSIAAYVEAMKIRQVCARPADPIFSPDDVLMLSIGTGKPRCYAEPPPGGPGIAWWISPLLTIAPLSQSQGAVFQAQYLLGDRYHRVDFDMPHAPWGLDAVDKIQQLCHLGRTEAATWLGKLRETVFTDPVPRYTPIPLGDPCAGLRGEPDT